VRGQFVSRASLEQLVPSLSRYLIDTMDHGFHRPVTSLFPNLRAYIMTEMTPGKAEGWVYLTEPVTYQCLFLNLLCIPLRPSARNVSAAPILPVISTILLPTDGTGTPGVFDAMQLSGLNWSTHSPIAPRCRLRWAGHPADQEAIQSPGTPGTRRLLDTLFGLLKLAAHAKSIEQSTTSRPGYCERERTQEVR
jgi:hypothetical protein